MESCFIPRSSHGIMDEREEEDDARTASFSSVDDEEMSGSIGSSSSDVMDDASSSSEEGTEAVFQMSNLIAHLPFKRGLSKHFHGKSQSFSSLSNVRRLEDLAKPENKYRKKLNASKRYGEVFDYNKALLCAKTIAKKSSRSPFSSLGPRRNDVLRSARPVFRSSEDLSSQALLFA